MNDEILIKEQLIEKIKKRIEKIEKQLIEYQNNNSKKFIPTMFLTSIITILLGTPIINIIVGNIDSLTSVVTTKIGLINEVIYYITLFSICFLPLNILILAYEHKDYKNKINNQKKAISELEYLKEKLDEEIIKLDKLKQSYKEEKEYELTTTSENNNLKELRNNLIVYSDIEKYYKYYQNNTLEEQLKKEKYNKEQIEKSKQIMRKNSPTLIKRR